MKYKMGVQMELEMRRSTELPINFIDVAQNRHANLSIVINIADTTQLSHP